jgi:hypothetical protein
MRGDCKVLNVRHNVCIHFAAWDTSRRHKSRNNNAQPMSGGGRFTFEQAFWRIARSYTCAVAAVVAAAYLGGFGGLKTLWATVTAW